MDVLARGVSGSAAIPLRKSRRRSSDGQSTRFVSEGSGVRLPASALQTGPFRAGFFAATVLQIGIQLSGSPVYARVKQGAACAALAGIGRAGDRSFRILSRRRVLRLDLSSARPRRSVPRMDLQIVPRGRGGICRLLDIVYKRPTWVRIERSNGFANTSGLSSVLLGFPKSQPADSECIVALGLRRRPKSDNVIESVYLVTGATRWPRRAAHRSPMEAARTLVEFQRSRRVTAGVSRWD